MAQSITTIDQLISAKNITEDTNFLVTQYTNSDKTTRQEYNINYTHLSSQIYNEVYSALSGQFSNFLIAANQNQAIENAVYNRLSNEFLKNIADKVTIGQQELLSTSTTENIIDAINNELTAKIDKENAYTKTDIDTLYRRIITVEDYLSSSSLAKENITEIFDDDTGLNEKSTILVVNPSFLDENVALSDIVSSYIEYSPEENENNEIKEDYVQSKEESLNTIISSDISGAYVSNFQYKPEVKTLTLQALIDYIKGKIPDMQQSYDSSNVTNTYYNSERLMHFRDNEYSFTTAISSLISCSNTTYYDYKTYSEYIVANTEEELMINFDVPVEQKFSVGSNAYAAIQIQINHVDNNNVDTKKWVNIVKKSLKQASGTTCSLQAHIIADKGMAIRGYVSSGLPSDAKATLNVNSIKYSVLNIDTLVEKENYIGNDPFPVNYTSYIYANDFNRKVNVNSNADLSDLNNFTEELNRVKIFGPATWLTAYVNQKITDLNQLISQELSCDYNLKISYTGTASTKNTVATVRCALLDMNIPEDRELLGNIIKYKYGEKQTNTTDYYSQLKWFNLGFNYIYTNTSNIGEVLLGQYYFPDNVYVVLDLGLNKATIKDTSIKVEYKHGHYSKDNEIYEAGNEFIDINTIKNEIFNDNSLTARISYELSTERCPNLSAVRTLSYGQSVLSVPTKTNVQYVSGNANFKLLTGYSYIRNNEKISSNISSGVYIPNNVGIGLMNNISRKQFTFTNKQVPGGYFGLSCNDDRITKPLNSIDGILYGFAEKFITQYVKGKVYQLSIQDCIDTLQLNNNGTTVKEFQHIESIRLNKGLTSIGNFCFTYCNMLSSIDFGNAQVARVPTCFAHISYNKNLSNYPQGANILLNKNVSSIANHINYDSHDSIKADLQRIIIPSQLTSNGSTLFCTKIPQVSSAALSSNEWLSSIIPEIDVILPETFNTFNDTVEENFNNFITNLSISSRTNLQLSDFTRTNINDVVLTSRNVYLDSLASQIEAISSAMVNLKSNQYICKNTNLNNVRGYKIWKTLTYQKQVHNHRSCRHWRTYQYQALVDATCISAHLLRANDRSYTGLIAVYYKNKVYIGTINTEISNIAVSDSLSNLT